MFGCGGCDHRWSGLNIAHCAACHCTFTTISAFDVHRDSDHCRKPQHARRSDGLHMYSRSLKSKDTWYLSTYDSNGRLRGAPSVVRTGVK